MRPTYGIFLIAWLFYSIGVSAAVYSPEEYSSIQDAIDQNPGTMIEIPPGRYEISEKLRIAGEGGGLYGYGVLIQTSTDQPILEIEHATSIRVTGLTLTRKEGTQECSEPGIFCFDSDRARLEGLTIQDNWGGSGAVVVRESTRCTVAECDIVNYKKITIDDRTANSEHYGYAFHAIDGHGIFVQNSIGTTLRDNRIVEERIHPDEETQEKYRLGFLTEGKHPSVEGKFSKHVFKRGYVDNWHQGSGIIVTGPTHSSENTVRGNTIVNAGQGIDLHCDRTLCSDNIVKGAMIGIKATHGARNLLIANNLLSGMDLWGILLNPGTGSFHADETREENVDGGTVIANNIITDFGMGPNYWNWGGKSDDLGNSFAIALYGGQLETNPPLSEIVVSGNLVYNTSSIESASSPADPKYRYALYFGSWNGPVEEDLTRPKNLTLSGNRFEPGKDGISNLPLESFSQPRETADEGTE